MSSAAFLVACHICTYINNCIWLFILANKIRMMIESYYIAFGLKIVHCTRNCLEAGHEMGAGHRTTWAVSWNELLTDWWKLWSRHYPQWWTGTPHCAAVNLLFDSFSVLSHDIDVVTSHDTSYHCSSGRREVRTGLQFVYCNRRCRLLPGNLREKSASFLEERI